jgi:hypothetical protein
MKYVWLVFFLTGCSLSISSRTGLMGLQKENGYIETIHFLIRKNALDTSVFQNPANEITAFCESLAHE